MKTPVLYPWPDDFGQEFHDLQELTLNINTHSGALMGSWGNLGYWLQSNGTPIKHYNEAAQQLAHELAVFAQLQPEHRLLDIGFGCGDQIVYWQQKFSVERIWGVNFSTVQTQYAKQTLDTQGCAAELAQGNACESNAWQALPPLFDRIIALDCVYHFSDRPAFYRLCATHLAGAYNLKETAPQCGELVVSDLILSPSIRFFQLKILKLICTVSHIPFNNLKTLDAYEHELNQAGLQLLESKDISSAVMQPFSNWVGRYRKAIKILARDKQHRAKLGKITWGKYIGTALFLSWAARHAIFQYRFMRIAKNNA